MATLHCSARLPQAILRFHRPSFRPDGNTTIFFNRGPNAAVTHFRFRLKNAARLQERQRSVLVFASNTNPSEASDVAKSSDNANAQGPPVLTILAGFFVFLVLCWIIGSIVTWLIGLIVNPPSK